MVFVTVVMSSILWLAGAPNAHATPSWCGPEEVQAAFFVSEVTESDLRFNSNQNEAKFFATDSKPGNCSNLFDLEGIATHERGHTFGLGDINANDHPNLTMRGAAPACTLELRSLGKGDIQGLNALY